MVVFWTGADIFFKLVFFNDFGASEIDSVTSSSDSPKESVKPPDNFKSSRRRSGLISIPEPGSSSST